MYDIMNYIEGQIVPTSQKSIQVIKYYEIVNYFEQLAISNPTSKGEWIRVRKSLPWFIKLERNLRIKDSKNRVSPHYVSTILIFNMAFGICIDPDRFMRKYRNLKRKNIK
jgi:hypothetical protein